MNPNDTEMMEEPPEGVISGDSIPRENEEEERDEYEHRKRERIAELERRRESEQ